MTHRGNKEITDGSDLELGGLWMSTSVSILVGKSAWHVGKMC
jgi:hypothetical protein